MLACCQEKVFANERTAPKPEDEAPANASPSRTMIEERRTTRYSSPDFMRNKTWLDMLKVCGYFALCMDFFHRCFPLTEARN